MRNSFVIISFVLSASLAQATALQLTKVICKSKNGSEFSLEKNEDSSYSLLFTSVTKVFGDGYYRLNTTQLAKKLSCSRSSSDLNCQSTEEVEVDIPKAGVRNQVVSRKHSFRIGSRWDQMITLQNSDSTANLSLDMQATFAIDLSVGEVMVKGRIEGSNVKTHETEVFYLDKSNLFISLQDSEASCIAKLK